MHNDIEELYDLFTILKNEIVDLKTEILELKKRIK